MTKVMHIITRLDMGGSAQNTIQTCIGLAGKYEMALIHGLSLESKMTPEEKKVVAQKIALARKKGVRVISCSYLVRSIHPIKDLIALWFLFAQIRGQKPHIVHTHSSKAGILGRLAAWIARVPLVVHTTHGHVFYGHFNPILSTIFLIVERIAARGTDVMVALTEGERLDYIRYRLCPKNKIVTIHSGVEIGRFSVGHNADRQSEEIRKALGVRPDQPVIGTVGWLLPIKGPDVLLKAFNDVRKTFPELQLVYVGKGDLLDELKTEAERMGAGRSVHFLGWRKDVHHIIPAFDLFVLPSLNEGMGRVLVEAMAAGRPVIASDTGGIPDIVKHKHNGLLVPPGDRFALAAAITWMLQHPQQAEKMGEAGREYCRKFSLEAMLEKIDGLYQKLCLAYPAKAEVNG